ncbi:hypothetical protein FHR81_005550 [Actinoalloteichus hoggarensis]|uniref:lantibiotic dehydratase n=1 Tax=Actinoalloteichus hoggarensis TaxID=1470176 RepID=UPI0012FE17D1|nr:lantibiotic dehydratase [Actinoalloteichus hoggarensis]MBB5924465.1 hypothetical protein [Actinoalloteichus hoggarensis]
MTKYAPTPVAAPFQVVRRCLLPFDAVRDLGDGTLWRTAEAQLDAEARRARAGVELAEVIAGLVPAADRTTRGQLLRLRRAVFNGRTASESDLAPMRVLDPQPLALGRYQAAASEADTLARRRTRLEDDLRLRVLATSTRVLANADFAAALEVAVPRLASTLRSSAPPDPADGARSRRQALTLLRLAYRAATKPTPFARFVESVFVMPGAAHRPPRGHVRLAADLRDELRAWASAGDPPPAPHDALWITTNPTARLTEDRVEWLDSSGGERLLRAPCSSRLARLLTRLRRPVLLAEFGATGTDRVPPVLAALLRRGLLEIGFPPGTRDAVLDPRTPAATALDTLRAIERTWPEEARGEPSALIRATRATTEELAGVLSDTMSAPPRITVAQAAAPRPPGTFSDGAGAPVRGADADDDGDAAGEKRIVTGRPRPEPVDVPSDHLVEDLHGMSGNAEDLLPLDYEVRSDLGLLQRVLPLAGGELSLRIAESVCFRSRFSHEAVPALTAYRWHREEGAAAAERLIAESTHPVLREVLRLRRRALAALTALAADAADAAEVYCDRAALHDLAEALPATVGRWACVAWPVQATADGLLVVNGASSGYGRFAARHTALMTPQTLEEVRAWAESAAVDVPLEASAGLPADIGTTLGASVNDRVRLLPAVLGYPNAAVATDPEARVDLGDCTVRVHPDTGRLLLEGGADTKTVFAPVPQNGTLPQLAPPLYRWLAGFGPSLGTTLPLWDRVDERRADLGVRHYPRLRLGRLILARRTWKVSADALPGTGADLLAWRRFCRDTGIPRRVFLRRLTVPDTWDVLRGEAAEERVLLARSRAGDALRKPAYLDLSQSLCHLGVEAAPDGGPLTFTEPLPDPSHQPTDRVTEFVIETSLGVRHERQHRR